MTVYNAFIGLISLLLPGTVRSENNIALFYREAFESVLHWVCEPGFRRKNELGIRLKLQGKWDFKHSRGQNTTQGRCQLIRCSNLGFFTVRASERRLYWRRMGVCIRSSPTRPKVIGYDSVRRHSMPAFVEEKDPCIEVPSPWPNHLGNQTIPLLTNRWVNW